MFRIIVRGVQGLLLLLFVKRGQEKDRKVRQSQNEGGEVPRGERSRERNKGGPDVGGKYRKERKKDKVTEGKQRAEVKAEYFDRRADGVHSHSMKYITTEFTLM